MLYGRGGIGSMSILRIKRTIGWILSAALILINYSPFMQSLRNIPPKIYLVEENLTEFDLRLPFFVEVNKDGLNVSDMVGGFYPENSSRGDLRTERSYQDESDDLHLRLDLFGLIPIKRIQVELTPQQSVFPGGNSIGVSMSIRGALVVGISEVSDFRGERHHPAAYAGIRPGDIIESINNITVEDAGHLSEIINKSGDDEVDIEVKRGKVSFRTRVLPVKDAQDSKYRLGLWVRDSTAGVGTLTFYDAKNGRFGALGHAITDVDTGMLLSVKNGEIVQSDVIDVRQGRRGEPGELRGGFSERDRVIGDIVKNTRYGIYGKVRRPIPDLHYKKPLPIGCQFTVNVGSATLLTTIDGNGVEEFDMEIIGINRQNYPNPKGMIVQITDPDLLSRTGGIVQGMSGSPIIQNGRLVGAITHVFVNDPTKGYAIFIEWMLKEAEKILD
jgi:stage IV sporulation protein B